jgi:hypothetical protein
LTKDREQHEAKMKDIPPFRNMDKERDAFTSVREIYFEDPAIKKVIIIIIKD